MIKRIRAFYNIKISNQENYFIFWERRTRFSVWKYENDDVS